MLFYYKLIDMGGARRGAGVGARAPRALAPHLLPPPKKY